MMDIALNTALETYRDDMIRELSALVQIKSVNEPPVGDKPYGEGAYNALCYALELGKSLGFTCVNLDNHIGYAELDSCSTTHSSDGYVGVFTHLDVVPEGDGWSVPPYGGVVKDGRVYGRGVADNKVAAISALYGLRVLAESGYVPRTKIRIVFGCNEETGMDDMAYYNTVQPLPVFGIVPDTGFFVARESGRMVGKLAGECGGALVAIDGGSAPNIVPDICHATVKAAQVHDASLAAVAERYKVTVERDDDNVVLTATGVACHGASPQNGDNAVIKLIAALHELHITLPPIIDFLHERIGGDYTGAGLGIACADDDGKLPLTINVGNIATRDGVITTEFDIRYPTRCDGTDIARVIAEQAAGLTLDCDDSGPLRADTSLPQIPKLMALYTEATGKPAELACGAGGTYARKCGGRAIGFGGTGGNGHSADEYVVIDEMMEFAKLVMQAMKIISE